MCNDPQGVEWEVWLLKGGWVPDGAGAYGPPDVRGSG